MPDTDTHQLLAKTVHTLLPPSDGLTVTVTQWAGCDEPTWTDPVYVTASDDIDHVYYDAICDLAADTLDTQARYVVEQLLNG